MIKGLALFGELILAEISKGKKELLETIEQKMEEHDLVHYLNEKYDFAIDFEKQYDVQAMETFFTENRLNYSDWSRKFGLMNDEDGLLAVIACILNEYEINCVE